MTYADDLKREHSEFDRSRWRRLIDSMREMAKVEKRKDHAPKEKQSERGARG